MLLRCRPLFSAAARQAKPTEMSLRAALSCCVRDGSGKEAEGLVVAMERFSHTVDLKSMSCVLAAYAQAGDATGVTSASQQINTRFGEGAVQESLPLVRPILERARNRSGDEKRFELAIELISKCSLKAHLLRQTSTPFLALWTLFLWWAFVMITHSAWNCGGCISKSLGVSGIVGLGLNANGYAASGRDSIKEYVLKGPFSVARFFLIPFCVASYSAVANVKKDNFTYLFPHDGPEKLTYSGLGVIILVVFLTSAVILRKCVLEKNCEDTLCSSLSVTSLEEKDGKASNDDLHYVSIAQ